MPNDARPGRVSDPSPQPCTKIVSAHCGAIGYGHALLDVIDLIYHTGHVNDSEAAKIHTLAWCWVDCKQKSHTLTGVPAQDDSREREMILMFNLSVPADRTRGGLDAELEVEEDRVVPFELKSSTGNSVSTVRDFGPEHIAKWRHLHWLFAFYKKDGTTLRYCYYASPADMADWVKDKEQYVLPDYVLAATAPARVVDDDLGRIVGAGLTFTKAEARRIMKNQWSAEQYKSNADLPGENYSRGAMLGLLQQRCEYLIRRGSTLNNPHIPEKYLSERVEPIVRNHASSVRRLVSEYFIEHDEKIARGESPVEDQIEDIIADQASSASETDDATA